MYFEDEEILKTGLAENDKPKTATKWKTSINSEKKNSALKLQVEDWS